MNLSEWIRGRPAPRAWPPGGGLPWAEPGFSRRMLAEHLSQEHDQASRRDALIEDQVAWIHETLLGGRPGAVLDLGCGPGLYCAKLAARGHACLGVDVGPAAVAHAREVATREGLACRYLEGDAREVPLGEGHALAMMLFGEIDTFAPDARRALLARAVAALAPGGLLLLEPHRVEAVRRMGDAPPVWSTHERGLFSERPYLWLRDACFEAEGTTAIERHWIVDAESGDVAVHTITTQALDGDAWRALLAELGLERVTLHSGLCAETSGDHLAITARRAA